MEGHRFSWENRFASFSTKRETPVVYEICSFVDKVSLRSLGCLGPHCVGTRVPILPSRTPPSNNQTFLGPTIFCHSAYFLRIYYVPITLWVGNHFFYTCVCVWPIKIFDNCIKRKASSILSTVGIDLKHNEVLAFWSLLSHMEQMDNQINFR